MATAAQKNRKRRMRRAHQTQSHARNKAQGHTGGPDTAKRSVHPIVSTGGLQAHPPVEESVFELYEGGRCPKQSEFDDMVNRAKRRKRGVKYVCEKEGWTLVDDTSDPKDRDSWRINK